MKIMLFSALLLLSSCTGPAQSVSAFFPGNQIAPNFTLPVLTGDSIELKELRGKTVLLRFWATWCTICQTENPSLKELYFRFQDDGLEILSVAIDKSPGLVRAYQQRNKVPFPLLLDTSQQVQVMYQAAALPQSFLIGPDGTLLLFPDPESGELVDRVVGARDWSSKVFVKALERYLEE